MLNARFVVYGQQGCYPISPKLHELTAQLGEIVGEHPHTTFKNVFGHAFIEKAVLTMAEADAMLEKYLDTLADRIIAEFA